MKPSFLVVGLFLCILEYRGISAAELKFNASAWGVFPYIKQAYILDRLDINCQTNDPNATVSLQISFGAGYTDAGPLFKSRLVREGQHFLLSIRLGDGGKRFRCSATNGDGQSKVLELGTLIVMAYPREADPDLIPNVDVLLIEQGEDKNISCEALGSGSFSSRYLSWFREVDGEKIPVGPSQTQTNYIMKGITQYEVAILMIKRAAKADEGKYTCVRDVGGKSRESSITIKLDAVSPPIVTLKPASGQVTVRERKDEIFAICTVSGSPRPDRAWYFKNKTVARCPDRSIPYCYLEILKPIYEDSGVYECKAKNINGTSSLSLNVQVLVPVTLEKPGSKVFFGLNRPVDLSCVVKRANPLPTLTWRYQPYPCSADQDCEPRKDSWMPILNSNMVSPDSSTPANQSILRVGKSEQSSFYSCVANNTVSVDVYTFSLRRIDNPPVQFAISPVNPKVDENQTLIMTCTAQFYVFEGTRWLKNEKPLPSHVNQTVVRKQGLWENTIHINSSSERDQGNYTCVGTRRQGGRILKYSYVYVEALKVPGIHGFDNQQVFEGNVTSIILCNTSGYPKPTLSWKFNDRSIITTNILDGSGCVRSTSGYYFIQNDNNRRLVLCKPLYLKHAGNYSCKASSPLGTVEKTKKLVIFAPPAIIDWPQTVKFLPSETVSLICRSRGYPTPEITWWKVSQDGAMQQMVLKSDNNSTAQLELTKTSVNSQGNYTCRSSNKYGVDERITELIAEDALTPKSRSMPAPLLATAVVVPVLAILILCCIYVLWYRRRLEKQYALGLQPGETFKLDPNKSLLEQSGNLPYDPEFEFPKSHINLQKTVGSGAFGEVWLADAFDMSNFDPRDRSQSAMKQRKKLRAGRRKTFVASFQKERSKSKFYVEDSKDKIQVAVKTLKENASDDERRDLASELKILIHLGSHKNLVNLLGACTKAGDLMVILEYCPHGNLLSFLKDRRPTFEPDWYKLKPTMAEELTYVDLMRAAHGIARGMEYLSLRKCVHRDLAARNILISSTYTVKIADFGLARDIGKNEYYRKSTTGLLPIKWMAPESLFEYIYTDKTDVWSFGILLWEIFTLGGSPYPGLPPAGLYEYLAEGGRMSQPDLCPDGMYEIMTECWEENGDDRPSFTFLLDRLEGILHENIKKDADTVTSDGYMNPQDKEELLFLRESKRKIKKDRPRQSSAKQTDSPSQLSNKHEYSNSKRLESDGSLGSQYLNPTHNSYVELRAQESPSSNELLSYRRNSKQAMD